ncbi:hypothetical protein NP493_804g00021 [Ridgeia piscesae]|uniref:Uncharacterized protein n=1 Tax=Ridgeia piscesae TaxID=27915 RepID=A0AAD9KMQ2_RIDPI|nr:hypothetical protein NP493_804g00021 [Ridgeia piscesae]
MCQSSDGKFVYLLVETYQVLPHRHTEEQLCKRVGFRRFIVHPRSEGKKHRTRLQEQGFYTVTSIMTLLHAPNSDNCPTRMYPTRIKFTASLKTAGKPATSNVSLLTTPVVGHSHMTGAVSASVAELPNLPLDRKRTVLLQRQSPIEVQRRCSTTTKSMVGIASVAEMVQSMGHQSRIPVNEGVRKYVTEMNKASAAAKRSANDMPRTNESSSLPKIPWPPTQTPYPSRQQSEVQSESRTPASNVAVAEPQIEGSTYYLSTLSEKPTTPSGMTSSSDMDSTRATMSMSVCLSDVESGRSEPVSFTEVEVLTQTPSEPKQEISKKQHKKRKEVHGGKRTILDQLPVAYKAVPMGTEALIGAILPAILPALATVPSMTRIDVISIQRSSKREEFKKKEPSGILVSTKNFVKSFKHIIHDNYNVGVSRRPSDEPESTPVESISGKPTVQTEMVRMRRDLRRLRHKVAQLEVENEYLSYAGPDLSYGSGSEHEISLCECSDAGSLDET